MLFQGKKENSFVGVKAIAESSEALLSQLNRKELYFPFIEKMPEHRKQEWLSVRTLLKEMLSGEEKEIKYYPSGKPYLADHSYYISISHTKGYVAVIINESEPVAIDVESISPRIEKIQERFLSEEETNNLSEDNKLIHTILHWTGKECLFKILEESEIEFRFHLQILPFLPQIDRWDSFLAKETRSVNEDIYMIDYFVSDDFVLSLINGSRKKGLPLRDY